MAAAEIRVDCAACRGEGSRLEIWTAEGSSDRLGVPTVSRCLLCGGASEGRAALTGTQAAGEGCPECGALLDEASLEAHRCPSCGLAAHAVETAPSRPPSTLEELERALTAWALAEGLSSSAELMEGYFVLESRTALLEAIARGERIETTFDVVDYLFSSGSGQGEASPNAVVARAPVTVLQTPVPAAVQVTAPAPNPFARPGSASDPAPPSAPRSSPFGWNAPPASVRGLGGPFDELLALASVAASDGVASEADLQVLAAAATARGLPLLPMEEIRVRRPAEILAPPTLVRREALLEEMFHMAWSDDELDESEVRVIREFARAWGVDPQRVTDWARIATTEGSSRVARWFDRVGYFLFPGW